MAKPTDLVQGTLDLLILKTLALQPMHGWGIAQRIRQVSKDVLQVNQGALYPALHRLERDELAIELFEHLVDAGIAHHRPHVGRTVRDRLREVD